MPDLSNLPTEAPEAIGIFRDILGIATIENRLVAVEESLPVVGVSLVTSPNIVSTDEDVPVTGNLLTNDVTNVGVLRIDEYWVAGRVGSVAAGVATTIAGVGDIIIYSDGEYSFTPGLNYNGPVPLINYRVSNGKDYRGSSLAITITNIDDPPVANTNAAMTAVDEPVTFGVLGNDFDPENSSLTLTHLNDEVATVGLPIAVTGGTVTRNLDNTLTFNPTVGFEGVSIFTYTVSDGNLSSLGTINVIVGFEDIAMFSPVSPIIEGDFFDENAVNFGNTAMDRLGSLYNNGVNVSDATYTAAQGNFDLGTREPWLYDRATIIYKLYLRTQDPTIRAKALEYAELYMSGVVMTYENADFTTGGGQAGDVKYLYPIIAWWYERETGNPIYRPLAQGLYNQARASFPIAYSPAAALWTERNLNYAIQACLAKYWIFGDESALTAAEAYFDTLVQMSTLTGAPLHPHSQHEGTSIATPITSPWMSALLVETLLQLFRTNGNEAIVEWIARYCDFIVAHGFYQNTEIPEVLGLRVPAYLAGSVITYPDAGGPFGDSEHSYDVGIMLFKGIWAKLRMGDTDVAVMQELANECMTVAEFVMNDWTRTTQYLPKYRVNPPRKYAWWYNGAYSKIYFANVVPLGPINLSLPSVSGNQPAGSTITATPGTWAGNPDPDITYQWVVSVDEGETWDEVVGETGLTYDSLEDDVGFLVAFEETATNTGGTVTRRSTSTVLVTAAGSPVFTLQPTNQTVADGGDAIFTVTVTGSPTPTLQWWVSTDDGVTWNPVAGQTTATLTVADVSEAESGNRYNCIATNPGDAITSDTVTLYVAVVLDAISFTPSNGAVLTQALLPPGAANFTIEALVRFDDARIGARRVLSNRYIAGRVVDLGTANNFPDYNLSLGDSQTGWTGGTLPIDPVTGTWYKMTLSGDSVLDTGLFRGTIQALTGGTLHSATRDKGTDGVINHVGFEINGGGNTNEGLTVSYQYVRAYASERTLTEVGDSLNSVDTTNTLFWWVFEDNGAGGVTVRDASGNNRVPTLIGGTLTTGPTAPLI